MTEGIARLEAVIARLDEATERAREATAEAHSAVKAIRAAQREGRALIVAIEEAAKEQVDERMREAIDQGLDEFRDAYMRAIDRQVKHVTEVFERRSNLCMYGNEQGKGVNIFDAMGQYLAQFKETLEMDPRLPSLYGTVPPNSRGKRKP